MTDSKPSPMTEPSPSAAVAERVTINISGRRYETYNSVLRRLPHTLLGDQQRRAPFWDEARKEFFFDRCASSFEGILLAHQTGGDAWRPAGVPLGVFMEDLKFFGLTEQAARLTGGAEDGGAPPAESQTAGWRGLLSRPWAIAASQLVTLVAVVAYVVPTLESLHPQYYFTEWLENNTDSDGSSIRIWLLVLFVLELVCMLLVFAETVVRFLVSGRSVRFLRDPLNVLDLVMTVPFFLFFIIVLAIGIARVHYEYKTLHWLTNLVRVLRLFRIFRVIRGTRAAQPLMRAAAASARAFGIIFVIWMVAVVFFASLIHWALWLDQPFSIPLAIYLAVITMTTVGYGDLYPRTPDARFFAALCAYTGYVMAALPVAVFVTNLMKCVREDGLSEAKPQPNAHVRQGDPPPYPCTESAEMEALAPL